MEASSSAALALADRLRAMGDAELIALLRNRNVRDQGIRDFFDLADKLLEPASIAGAFATLPRPTLTVLAVAAELSAPALASGIPSIVEVDARLAELGAPTTHTPTHLDTVVALALAEASESGSLLVYAPVASEILGWPHAGLPSAAVLAELQPAALEALSDKDLSVVDGHAAESAFAITTAVGELLAELLHEPARELARGGLALPDSRRIATATASELDAVPALVGVAHSAGLMAREGGTWLTTTAAGPWMLLPTIDRWAVLAGSWLDGVAPEMRQLLASRAHAPWGDPFAEFAQWLYPAGGEWIRERIETFGGYAELLGIVSSSVPSSAGAALLTDGPAAAATAFRPLFPAEVSQVYVQHDLTIVSPGPLEPRVDARLRVFATVESRALAATYRVSAASVTHALALGETAASISEFLSEISLTGIPQPLEYLIADTATRHGAVRVGTPDGPEGAGRSYVRSDDSALLNAIQVDQSVSALALRKVSNTVLESRFAIETVLWALADAKYPVAAENSAQQIVRLHRRRAAGAQPAASADSAETIVERLRLLGTPTSGANDRAWLERQLDVAIKSKTPVTVTVALADDSEVDYVVQPTSVAGGRLRALDRAADIERTLPLSRIVAVSGAV
ncbi:MAG: helicase-associated domain-containing protein [Microbacteriaceae bacterium]